jgi:hypothetical protein
VSALGNPALMRGIACFTWSTMVMVEKAPFLITVRSTEGVPFSRTKLVCGSYPLWIHATSRINVTEPLSDRTGWWQM